jgi:hypothetical protein
MEINKSSAFNLLDGTIGIPIEITTNEFEEFAGNTHHKIVFQIQEEEPDIFAFGVLFALSLMSFTFSGHGAIPRSSLYRMKNGTSGIL